MNISHKINCLDKQRTDALNLISRIATIHNNFIYKDVATKQKAARVIERMIHRLPSHGCLALFKSHARNMVKNLSKSK